VFVPNNITASNGLSGSLVDEVGSLDSLRYLSISGSRIGATIPSSFGDLSRLLILDLNFNYFTGIPEELYGLPNLEKLELSRNQISGTISTRIGDLQNLTDLNLSLNRIIGTIPPQMGKLKKLRKMKN